MPENSVGGQRPRMTGVQWAICVVAAIGFAFDTYELLMMQLVVRPALTELGGLKPGSTYDTWRALMFYVPAICGGAFGLLGGYLTDLLGRRRVLTWSIVIYAASAFGAGYSTSLGMLLVLRCTTFIGVCVEFVAAVAWLAELFDDPHQRERVLGYTQAFSSIGGLMMAIVNSALVANLSQPQSAWRYTLMSGLVPALPLLLVRPWLPESPKWLAQKKAGRLQRPRLSELFSPQLARTTIVTTIMVALGYGAAFGAIQMAPEIAPRLSDVQAAAKKVPPKLVQKTEQAAASNYMKLQELGGLLGRVLLALLAVRIVSRRRLVRVFITPGLIVMPLVFVAFALSTNNPVWMRINLSAIYLGVIPITPLHLAIFVAGLLTVAQFSFWGNYLPRMYPVHLRGTGESFASNVGGRMIGTSFAAVTPLVGNLFFHGAAPEARIAFAAAVVGGGVFLGAFIASFFLPEPKAGDLPQ